MRRTPSKLHQEDFVSESGLHGAHFSCHLLVEAMGRKGETVNHCYAVTNASARCVRINYTAVPRRDAEGVHQMIRKTLALQ